MTESKRLVPFQGTRELPRFKLEATPCGRYFLRGGQIAGVEMLRDGLSEAAYLSKQQLLQGEVHA
jgi:hypothetical protein